MVEEGWVNTGTSLTLDPVAHQSIVLTALYPPVSVGSIYRDVAESGTYFKQFSIEVSYPFSEEAALQEASQAYHYSETGGFISSSLPISGLLSPLCRYTALWNRGRPETLIRNADGRATDMSDTALETSETTPMAFASDGSLLAVVGNRQASLIDTESGEHLTSWTLPASSSCGHESGVAIDPITGYTAVAYHEGSSLTTQVYDLGGNVLIETQTYADSSGLAFGSPVALSGDRLVILTDRSLVYEMELYDIATGENEKRIRHPGPHLPGARVVEGIVLLLQDATKAIVVAERAYGENTSASQDGAHWVQGCHSIYIHLWDLENSHRLWSRYVYNSQLMPGGVALSPDENYFAILLSNGEVLVWELPAY